MRSSSAIHFLAILSLLGGLVALPAFAQPATGPGRGMPRYDKSTEVTLSGTVDEVDEQTSRIGWKSLHLALETGEQAIDVQVGPASYVGEKGFSFAKGDAIEVVGSKLEVEGALTLVAREIKKGDQTLTLRDAEGRPSWLPHHPSPPDQPPGR